jgi:hypothetical protein
VTLILFVSGISNAGAVDKAVADPIDVLMLKSEKQVRIAAQLSPVVRSHRKIRSTSENRGATRSRHKTAN